MKDLLLSMLSGEGKTSSLRIMMVLIVTASMGMLLWQAAFCDDIDWVEATALIGTALGMKVGQKYGEKKVTNDESTDS